MTSVRKARKAFIKKYGRAMASYISESDIMAAVSALDNNGGLMEEMLKKALHNKDLESRLMKRIMNSDFSFKD